jgi:hypothetical protein
MHFNALVPKDQRSKPLDQMLTVSGVPLINYGLTDVFNAANRSLEGYKYYVDASGYDPTYNSNAGSGVADIFGSSSISQLTPVKGMGAIPIHLASKFTASGGRIKMNTTVTEMDKCILNGIDIYVLSTYNYATGEQVWENLEYEFLCNH